MSQALDQLNHILLHRRIVAEQATDTCVMTQICQGQGSLPRICQSRINEPHFDVFASLKASPIACVSSF